MHFSEKVLITRTGKFKEYDLWVRFLSPSMGVLTGFAFGGCKSRRRFSGCLDVLNLVLFKASTGRRNQYLVLEEGSLINGYPRLKSDSHRLGMAVNSLRFVQSICMEGDDSSLIYSQMLNYLQALEDAEHVPSFLPLLFRARAVFTHGYQPLLDACRVCGKSISQIECPGFDCSEGSVVCKSCGPLKSQTVNVQKNSLLFLSQLRASEPGEWLSWSPEKDMLQDCFNLVETFVDYHLGREGVK